MPGRLVGHFRSRPTPEAAILVAGGLAIALPAQAAPAGKSVSVVEPVEATDTDNVQDESKTAPPTARPLTTRPAPRSKTARTTARLPTDDEGTEDTSDDVNGVEVEDGTQD